MLKKIWVPTLVVGSFATVVAVAAYLSTGGRSIERLFADHIYLRLAPYPVTWAQGQRRASRPLFLTVRVDDLTTARELCRVQHRALGGLTLRYGGSAQPYGDWIALHQANESHAAPELTTLMNTALRATAIRETLIATSAGVSPRGSVACSELLGEDEIALRS